MAKLWTNVERGSQKKLGIALRRNFKEWRDFMD